MRISSIFETHFNPTLEQKCKISKADNHQIVLYVLEMGKCCFDEDGTSSACGS